MEKKFLPDDDLGILVHVIEECAELQKAITKMVRFGPENSYPVSDVTPRALSGMTNREHAIAECLDVKRAVDRFLERFTRP